MRSKSFFTAAICILFAINIGNSQTFKLLSGAITSTPSDSRSINFVDINNDGWDDIFVSNGREGGQNDFLYINDRLGNFTEILDMDIVTVSNPSDGASFADYNNDGWLDGIVTSWYGAEDYLVINDGNGKLIYNGTGGILKTTYAETASFGDYNNDGWVDLYITNSGGNKKNYLYKNLKNGKFERITNHILVNDAKVSRTAIWTDANSDGKIDLFVTNEGTMTNDLYLSTGQGNFEKYVGALTAKGKGTMTSSWGDIDNDGDFDVFLGNSGFYVPIKNQLFMNGPTGFIENFDPVVTGIANCTFGSSFGDYDNDGDLDLLVSNGFCTSPLTNNLYENNGDGTFKDATVLLFTNDEVCSYGCAWGDVNNDGFLDLMFANCKNRAQDQEPVNTLLINTPNVNHWLKIRLEGVESNRNAIGSKVSIKATVKGKSLWQTREISVQTGLAGQNGIMAHFGLAESTKIDSINVLWTSGKKQTFTEINANQTITITEGQELTTAIHGVSHDSEMTMLVMPNPISQSEDSVHLIVTSDISMSNVIIILNDNIGKALWQSTQDINLGNNSIDIPIKDCKPGMYEIVLKYGVELKTKKLIIN